ncbi:hypothetical protein AABM38_11415 [Heyndrickxia sp. MSNUG]|uniref:hypothetical protein n=1 Tax=Heyndrickxia sp. MSNUG TaxID=3136677 RepID=UPI003C2CBED4
MNTKEDREQRALQSVELASKLKEDRGYIIGAIIGLTNMIVSKEMQQKMLEVFILTDAFREIQEEIKEQTRRDMRREDIFFLLDNEGYDDNSLKQQVSKINSFEYLDRIYRLIISKHPNSDELQRKITEFVNISKHKI